MTMKEYYRDELVYLSKIYERAERYSEMFKFVINFVKMDPNLNLEERNLLSTCFKNVIADKRASWRLLNHLDKKDEKKNSQNMLYLKEVKTKIEEEMKEICEEVQLALDKYLIPNSKDFETKVFYLKVKGDYFRYKAEFSVAKDYDVACLQAEKAYKDGYEIAEKNIPIFSSTRLGLALNYSVFYYEIKVMKEEAIHVARTTFEEAIKILDELEKKKSKDSLLIIQLLKENLILWNNEFLTEETLN